METDYLYPRIMSLIERQVGEENAIPWDQLLGLIHAFILGTTQEIQSQRKLLDVIRDMRRKGYVIGASQKGYFKPMSREEALGYLKFLASRAGDLWQTFDAQKRAIQREYSELVQLELPFNMSDLYVED